MNRALLAVATVTAGFAADAALAQDGPLVLTPPTTSTAPPARKPPPNSRPRPSAAKKLPPSAFGPIDLAPRSRDAKGERRSARRIRTSRTAIAAAAASDGRSRARR